MSESESAVRRKADFANAVEGSCALSPLLVRVDAALASSWCAPVGRPVMLGDKKAGRSKVRQKVGRELILSVRLCFFLGKQREKHCMPNLVALWVKLTFSDQLSETRDIFVMHG
jgi:hypothetical protein